MTLPRNAKHPGLRALACAFALAAAQPAFAGDTSSYEIIGFSKEANNAVGYAHAEYEVMLHRHFYKQLRVK